MTLLPCAAGLLVFFATAAAAMLAFSRASHPKGRWAAACIVAAWLVMLGVIAWMLVARDPDEDPLASPLTTAVPMGVAGIVFLGLTAAGMVLGVLALLGIRRERAKWTARARWQAWSVLIATGSLVPCLIPGFIPRETPALADDVRAEPHQPGEILRFPDLNFTFETPSHVWVHAKTEKVNPSAALAFLFSSPSMGFMVIVENVAADSPTPRSTEQLAEFVDINQRQAVTTIETLGRETRVVAGVEGVELRFRDPIAKVVRVFWVHAGSAFGYQLVTWGPDDFRGLVLGEARRLASGFRLIDAGR